MVRVLFKRFLSEEDAVKIAGGWGGDRFVAFQRGGEIAFIWATVWDSPRDAKEFSQGYQKLLSKKYDDSGASASRAYMEQRENRVVVVEGLEKPYLNERIEKIWQGMELKEEKF